LWKNRQFVTHRSEVRDRFSASVLKLTEHERVELQHQAEARDGKADSARHAKLILLLADGLNWAEIRARLHCSDSYIARWSKRFSDERLAGLYSKHAGRERYKVTDRLESRVLRRTTQHLPSDGSGKWSSRKLAAELGGTISHTTVARIWAKHGLTPQCPESNAAPYQPSFDARMADVVGFYLSRPQHAAVFSVDETKAESADNPSHPGASDHAGMQALYAALKSHRGRAAGVAPRPRHSAAEFAAFLAAIAANGPGDKKIHVIADNPPAAKSRAFATLMADHPGLHMQFIATYAAWLDQVERSLAEMERDLNARSGYKPAPGLRRKLMRRVRRGSQCSLPMKWNYFEKSVSDQAVEHPGSRDR
jgi:transposase